MKSAILIPIKGLVILTGFLLMQHQAEAQLLKKLTDRAVDGAVNRLEKRGEKAVDQGLDTLETKIFGNTTGSSTANPIPVPVSNSSEPAQPTQQQGGTTIINNYYGQQPPTQTQTTSTTTEGNYNVNIDLNGLSEAMGQLSKSMQGKYESSYTFDKLVKVQVDASDDNQGPMIISQYMSDNANLITMDQDGGKFITDYKNGSMIVLDDKEMSAMAISLDFTENIANMQGTTANIEALYNMEGVVCKPGGKTKIILGYTCQNWQCESEDGIYKAWITDEVLFATNGKDYGRMSNLFSLNYALKEMGNGITGTALEVEYYDKESKATATFKVVGMENDINYIFDTTKYTFSNPYGAGF